ncbi:MAG: hypothetical protein L6U61_09265 [Bacteroidales bacterium]|nr:MAG: hypothetical protein L6U61_09265 [Bacteroidales bacterium]
MKRLSLLILFAVLLALPALSQQISVESFTPLENDLTANTAGTMKKDQNGKTCALIKVVTSERLQFRRRNTRCRCYRTESGRNLGIRP